MEMDHLSTRLSWLKSEKDYTLYVAVVAKRAQRQKA